MIATLLNAGFVGPTQSPTLALNNAAPGQTALVFCTGPVTLDVDGPSSDPGWVRDFYKVSSTGFAIFRLPASQNYGGTLTLKITTNGAFHVAYVAVQGNIGLPLYGNFGDRLSGWTTERSILSGSSTMGTDLHTFAQAANTFAVFPLVQIDPADVSLDVANYDQSYTELGDSGITPVSAARSRLWLAYKANQAMANDGVTATTSAAANVTTPGWFGMAAYALDYPNAMYDSSGNELAAYLKAGSGLELVRPNFP